MRELSAHEIDAVAGGLYLSSDRTYVAISTYVAAIGVAKGHTALAEADAYGYGTFTDAQTVTTPYSSQSSAASVTSGY